MTISDIRLSPVNEIAEKALKELGVPKRDTNGKTQFGASFLKYQRLKGHVITLC